MVARNGESKMSQSGWKQISFLGILILLPWIGGRSPALSAPAQTGKVLFDEPFEDSNWE